MDDAKLVAASAISLAVTLFALFSMRPLARRLGLVDRPDSRKRHRGRVPLVGGLCFFLGTVAGLLYLGYIDGFVASLLVPCALIVMTGAVDDLHNLSVRSRLLIQTCAAGMVIAASGVYLDHTGQIFGTHGLELGALGIPLTIVAVIGLINAFNMLDGIDGLAASLAMVSIGSIMLFAGGGMQALGVMLLLQVLFASLIPYLCVNMGWPDGRKVFMGDAGSTLIGFMLAWSLVFLSHHGVDRIAPVDALWCVALPVMDTLAVMVRRARKGMSPFMPDRQHLHHLLQDTGCTPRVTLACIVGAAGGLTLMGYALRNAPDWASLLVFATILGLYVARFQQVLQWVCGHLVSDESMTEQACGDAALARAVLAGDMPLPGVRNTSLLKALCVMATPPDAIRLAPVAEQLSKDSRFDTRVCVAAQPDQTPEQVLSLFGIEPDMHLEIPSPGDDPADVASRALGGMKRVLDDFKPDVVLVPGSTATTLATTLAAFYEQIPVVCIEPGGAQARPASDRLDEANRKITRTLASLHFTPSESAGDRLRAEGVPSERIIVAGNTAMGTLRTAAERIRNDSVLSRHLSQCFAFLRAGSPLLLMADRESMQFGNSDGRSSYRDSDGAFPRRRAGDASPQRRRASDIQPNSACEPICQALIDVAITRPDVDIVYPIDERDPSISDLKELLRGCPNIHLIEPTDYLSFAYLLNHADAILADSADLAFEVASFGKPVLLVQDQAGVSPAMDAGNVVRVALHERTIAASLLDLLEADGESMQADAATFHRDASRCIVDAIANLRHAHPIPAVDRTVTVTLASPAIAGLREAS